LGHPETQSLVASNGQVEAIFIVEIGLGRTDEQ
jgi:hypothetical protein